MFSLGSWAEVKCMISNYGTLCRYLMKFSPAFAPEIISELLYCVRVQVCYVAKKKIYLLCFLKFGVFFFSLIDLWQSSFIGSYWPWRIFSVPSLTLFECFHVLVFFNAFSLT
jgi:hypothetical protein